MHKDTPFSKPEPGVVDETRDLVNHAQRYYDNLRTDNTLGRLYRDNPYVMLAAAAGIGYVIAGGLLTPFTRRALSMGTKAMIIPLAATQIRNFTKSDGVDT